MDVEKALNAAKFDSLLSLSDGKADAIEAFVAHYRGESFSSIGKRYGKCKQAAHLICRRGKRVLIKANSIGLEQWR